MIGGKGADDANIVQIEGECFDSWKKACQMVFVCPFLPSDLLIHVRPAASTAGPGTASTYPSGAIPFAWKMTVDAHFLHALFSVCPSANQKCVGNTE